MIRVVGRQGSLRAENRPCRNPNKYLSCLDMFIHARASFRGGAARWTAPMRGRRQGCPRDIVRQLAAMLTARAASSPLAPGSAGEHEGQGRCGEVVERSMFIATGWDVIDRALAPASPRDRDSDALAHVGLGGLQRGAVHEWLCGDHTSSPVSRRRWLPPHSLFIHLAWRAIEANDGVNSSGLIIWIGRRVWPQARALRSFTTEDTENAFWIPPRRICDLDFGFLKGTHQSTHPSRRLGFASIPFAPSSVPSVFSVVNSSPIQHSLLSRSLFIDPPDDASRLWAIDLSLRSPATSVVIADGSKLKMAESRRLQLAAERGRALGLLARPSCEWAELSAAATRWRVRRTPSSSFAPRWIVELLRCKQLQGRSGVQALSTAGGTCGGAWEVEYVMPGCVRLVADVVHRSGSPAREARVNAAIRTTFVG